MNSRFETVGIKLRHVHIFLLEDMREKEFHVSCGSALYRFEVAHICSLRNGNRLVDYRRVFGSGAELMQNL